MPPFAILALLGAGLYAGYRWYARTADRIADEMKQAEDELRRATVPVEKNLGKLEFDPISGVYRPVQRD